MGWKREVCAPAKKWDYGEQRPSSVKDVALQAKDWKKVRWREGTKGWLESRFLVMLAHSFLTLETMRRKKKLLGGPGQGTGVKSNTCSSRGQATVLTAGHQWAIRVVRNT